MNDLPLIQNANMFLSDRPSVYAFRQQSLLSLTKKGYPTLKSEAWKYTDIRPILNQKLTLEHNDLCNHCHCQTEKDDSFALNIFFCNGKLHIEDFNTPPGLNITPLPLALYNKEYTSYIGHAYDADKHPFAALNGFYLEEGLCICVEKAAKIAKPLTINYNAHSPDGRQIHLHNIFIIEKGADIEIVENYTADSDATYFNNIVNEIYIKEGGKLNHYIIQKESYSAYHIALNAAKIQKSGTYHQYYKASGAKISRHENLINLEGPSANAEIYAAYTAKKECLNDITTNINHLSQNTTSSQYVKGVLEENSSAVFQGKIHIAPHADKTCGTQLHKALYLNDNANLNCKPELEIFADDVKCSHGASCGEINKDQLFYLISRGISKKEAIKILTEAHLNEIFALIPNEKIQNKYFY